MVAIINYGLGNINAFCNIYRKLNIDFVVADSEEGLIDATKLILPGVGSFDRAMDLLNRSGMRDTIDELVLKDKVPIMGVCVGLQILGLNSEEGNEKGLGYIEAEVKKISSSDPDLVLPHMGWNNIIVHKNNNILHGLDHESKFYFLHSYFVRCNDENISMATSNYFLDFTSIVNFENIFGVQFHPEKSHDDGTQLLKNFAEL